MCLNVTVKLSLAKTTTKRQRCSFSGLKVTSLAAIQSCPSHLQRGCRPQVEQETRQDDQYSVSGVFLPASAALRDDDDPVVCI